MPIEYLQQYKNTSTENMLRLLLSRRFFATTCKQYEALFQQKKYKQILGVKNDANIQDIKAKFFVLIKKYHPDVSKVQSQDQAEDNNKISKILISSYEEVLKASGYKDWKQEFMKGEGSFSQSTKEKTKQDMNMEKKEETFRESMVAWATVGLISLLGIAIYYRIESRKKQKLENMVVSAPVTKERVQRIIQMDLQKKEDRKQQLIQSYVKQHPPMLYYPSYGDVDIITQLKKFSILYDITLYELPSTFFNRDFIVEKNYTLFLHNSKQPITMIRPHTIMTLALEAERMLQNTYVNRADLLKQLTTKGYYKPPGILFRFYGFIYFELRDKPLNLANYKEGDQWISLFDLYFKYYSPLFIRKNKYNEYSALSYADHPKDANKSNENFIGSVHLNHRPVNSVYLKPGQRVVFFYRNSEKPSSSELKNHEIWNLYYTLRAATFDNTY